MIDRALASRLSAAAESAEFALSFGRCPFCGPTCFRAPEPRRRAACAACAARRASVHLVDRLGDCAKRSRELRRLRCLRVFRARRRSSAYLARARRAASRPPEYFADVAPGAMRDGMRCEDVQRLSYADASFDLVTHTEVLEHVPDDARALARTVSRAAPRRHDAVHGAAARRRRHDRARALARRRRRASARARAITSIRCAREGILAFRDYGRDIVDRLRAAGFVDARILAPSRRRVRVDRRSARSYSRAKPPRNRARGTRHQLLIDTDPGIDDALAILMAHAHADVAALTIAGGNVGLAHTTRNALKLVEMLGADTPVFPGCASAARVRRARCGFRARRRRLRRHRLFRRRRVCPKKSTPRARSCDSRASGRAN